MLTICMQLYSYVIFMGIGKQLFKSIPFLLRKQSSPTDELTKAVVSAQQSILYQQLMPLAVLPILTSTFVALSLMTIHPPLSVLLWYLVYIPLPGTLFLMCLAHRRKRRLGRKQNHTASTGSVGNLSRKAETVSLLSGVFWGSTTLLFGFHSVEILIFMAFIQVSQACGFAQMVAALPRMVFRFVAPTLIPVTVIMILQPSMLLVTIGLTVLAVLTSIMMSSFADYRQLSKVAQSEFRARRAEALLRSSLNAMPDAFAVYGFDREMILENANHESWALDYKAPTSSSGEQITQASDGRWIKHSWNLVPEVGTLTIHTDITSQKQREALLIEAREQAQRARGAQSRFLSSVSHELRTPLNSVLGFSELLGPITAQRQNWPLVQEYTDYIHSSGRHLLSLVNDIIDYTTIGDDNDLVNKRAVDMPSTIKRAIEVGRAKAGAVTEHKILSRLHADLNYLKTDGYILERIISNVVSNSIKFSASDSKIAISTSFSKSGNPIILIRDFGQGMTPEQVKNAFTIFYKADDSHTREAEGTGMGLALVQKLADLIDVKVQIASKVGRGTAVMLTFDKASLLDPVESSNIITAKSA